MDNVGGVSSVRSPAAARKTIAATKVDSLGNNCAVNPNNGCTALNQLL
jgi:hypothetical protein